MFRFPLSGLSPAPTLRRLLFLGSAALLAAPLSAQTNLWSESFETDGNSTRYTATEFTDGSGDFFTRTDGSNITGSYSVSGADGSFFFAGQDTNGEPEGGATVSITFNPIDITGFSALNFSALFSEDDDGSNQDWDADALVYVEASIDGAPAVKILQFASQGGTNTEPGLDTDFDGVADGTALTSAFSLFSAAIPGAGSSLTLTVTLENLEAGDEDVAFDLLEVTGTPAGPTSLWVEDFETDGNPSRYTAMEFSDGSGDFFTRTDGANITGTYSVLGGDGSFFFAGMDTNGEPEGGSVVSITFNPINVNGFSALSFSGLFAEDDDGANQDWDADALVYVEASLDGGPFSRILQFASQGATNTEPGLDSDFDGVRDGAALTSTFASFSGDIAGTGSVLILRITLENLEAGDEDIAFDLLQLEGVQSGGGCTDAAAPMAVCQAVTLYLDENGQAVLDPTDLDGGSTDDCTPAELLTFSASQTMFDCSDIASAPIASGLFISEYVEGSGFTKYVEVFNGTGSAVDLADYELHLYANGNTSPNSVTSLSGMLADGEVVVLANSQATEYTGPVQVISAVNFNGDDAVELYNTSSGQTMDIFGTIGEDPGSQWSDPVSGNNTQNVTLRRKMSVTMGVQSNPAPGFPTLGTEWDEYANNDVSGLGAHSLGSAGVSVTLTVTDESGKSSSCVAQVTVMDNLGPNVICTSPTLVLDENGQASLTAEMVDGGTFDNCSAVTLSINKTSFDCSDAAAITTGDDLFISEYVEGSGFTKYVELYNGTGSTVDLSNYEFRLYSNGNSTANSVQTLSGTLANGQVVVLANPSATSYAGATLVLSAVNFNGDDAVEIYNLATGKTADIFGTIGQDPGSQWSAGGNSTQNATLRRKSSVSGGVTTNPGPGFPTLATEWDAFATDNIADLGMHTVDQLPGIPVTLTASDELGNISTCTALVNVVDNTAPVVSCMDINVQLDANGTLVIDENAVDDGSFDNCGALIFDTDVTTFTTADIGANPVVLTVTDASGNSATCNATVNVFAKGPAVFGFVLYDSKTDQPLMPLYDGAKISLPTLPTDDLAIRALPGTDPVESMVIVTSGKVNRTQNENEAPYFSFGNGGSDVYGKDFKPGVYTVSATPYSQDNQQGMQGATQTVTFELFVPAPEVTGFALVNPTTDQIVVDPMTDGEVVDLDALGGSFNILANVNLGDIESVAMGIFDMNGDMVFGQVENNAPYAVFGNSGNDFDPGVLPPGMYTMSAAAFTGSNASGDMSPIYSIDFIVTAPANATAGNGGLSSFDKGLQPEISLYPNPASHVIYADLAAFSGESVRLSVMNELGQQVMTETVAEAGTDPVMINLAGNRFTDGVYLLQVTTESGVTAVRRFVVTR